MYEEIEVKLAVKVPERIRRALRALKLERELAEGRPVKQGEIVAELVDAAAQRKGREPVRHA